MDFKYLQQAARAFSLGQLGCLLQVFGSHQSQFSVVGERQRTEIDEFQIGGFHRNRKLQVSVVIIAG